MRFFPVFGGPLLGFLVVLFVFAATQCQADEQVIEVVGLGECADCKELKIQTNQAFPGLHVTIDCKNKFGDFERFGVGKLNEDGKFKVSLPIEMLKDGNLKHECYAQLHSASSAPCPAQNGLNSMKIVAKNDADGKHITFEPAQKLTFSTELCTSATFLPFHKPLPKLPKIDFWKHHYKFPPYHKKPLPPVFPTPVPKTPEPPVSIPKTPEPPVTLPKTPEPPVTIPKTPEPPVTIPKKPEPPVHGPSKPDPRSKPKKPCPPEPKKKSKPGKPKKDEPKKKKPEKPKKDEPKKKNPEKPKKPMPPVVKPPVHKPPIVTPPIVEPPVHKPPIVTPPIVKPPVHKPPIVTPPIVTPPVVTPPIITPPIEKPPIKKLPCPPIFPKFPPKDFHHPKLPPFPTIPPKYLHHPKLPHFPLPPHIPHA